MTGKAQQASATPDPLLDTGEYTAEQVHQFRVGQHLEEDDPPPAPEEGGPDTGEYQSDQVRQVKHHD
ncbi:hypothetical protein [Crenobacter luteus]|uniref:Uncharacterized protein n=1 Tax=Crenobacter luteus TaxID=1452487 RepID=A0A165EKV3_9NEIS|nr:hypothetical protein [Crenobacter luteus]KZE25312.1 hypothetical protein AVW16_03145 [Crenobacter luteus]